MAGRRDKNTVDYFPHFVNQGKTVFIIENAFGFEGYSIWFKTLELLGSAENHFIDLRCDTDLLFLISKMKTTEQKLISIFDLLAKLGAIDSYFWDKKVVYSDNFIKNIQDAYTRRKQKCMQKSDLCMQLFNSREQIEQNCEPQYTEEKKVKETLMFDFLPVETETQKKLTKVYLDFVEFRKEIKKPIISQKTLEANFAQLRKLSGGVPDTAIEILNQSIANGWQGLFELKTQNK